jgi:AbrB family looped-hinge helix DNA binding protein
VKLNSKGQVTIPAPLRAKLGFHEGDEIDVIEEDGALRIVRIEGALSRGQRLVGHLRGQGTARESQDMTTDQLMDLLRGE